MFTPRDLLLARRAKRAGAHYALRIIIEARKTKLPVSLAFAVVNHESVFQNIFGCDKMNGKDHPLCHQRVTRERVLELLNFVHRGGWSNGVGLTQLTSPGFIYQAQNLGGAELPKNQLHVGFRFLKGLLQQYGEQQGLGAYNAGAGNRNTPTARRYARDVQRLQLHWHNVLDPKHPQSGQQG